MISNSNHLVQGGGAESKAPYLVQVCGWDRLLNLHLSLSLQGRFQTMITESSLSQGTQPDAWASPKRWVNAGSCWHAGTLVHLEVTPSGPA